MIIPRINGFSRILAPLEGFSYNTVESKNLYRNNYMRHEIVYVMCFKILLITQLGEHTNSSILRLWTPDTVADFCRPGLKQF